MKISRTTTVIALFLLIAAGAGFIYYYTMKNSDSAQAWVESSWAYRKSIFIENSEATKIINKDALLEIDTESLIKAGKLQLDCDDLRFQDEDSLLSLDYWIEEGCDTPSTKIWVRIPSFPELGKNVYMFYGNPNAPRIQEKLVTN